MTLRILNAEPASYSDQARRTLAALGELEERHYPRAQLLDVIQHVDVLIVRLGYFIDDELLARATRLKILATPTTGLDHIDLNSANRHGIDVLSLKGDQEFLDCVTATAELTWALLLALVRRLGAASRHVHEGGWDRDLFVGHELSGKAIGLIGHGRLGAIVADYARAFRMEVLANDPNPRNARDFVTFLPLEEVVARSDCLSLHIPLSDQTRFLVGPRLLSLVKPGAFLVNTSRGEVIDEQSVLDALETGKLAGYATDVLQGEVDPAGAQLRPSRLWQARNRFDNLIITPHIGGATSESMRKTELHLARKIAAALGARRPG